MVQISFENLLISIAIHESNIHDFIDYTKIFIIQCIKKINSESSLIRKAAVKAFASMINAVFITVYYSFFSLIRPRILVLSLTVLLTLKRNTKRVTNLYSNSKITKTLISISKPKFRLI